MNKELEQRNRALAQPADTLQTVQNKIAVMFDTSRPRQRKPVDCVAFEAIEVFKKGSYVHPWCNHPDRNGPTECILVEESAVNGERVKRRRGSETVCQQRVKNRERGAAALCRRMDDGEFEEIF